MRIILYTGKGGVGKSSIAVNVAVAMSQAGFRVGLLDADIWGFSTPRMLGVEDRLDEHQVGAAVEPPAAAAE